MKRLIYILVAFTALLTAACSQTIVFDEINEVVPPVSTTIQDNQIWYTTNSGGTVSPQNMPSVESNIYVNGKGIITFSQKLTTIETRAFEKCENLVTVTLPDCIENIAAEAFNECNSLTKINIPKSTSEIGQEAFCKCLSLKSITIPSSVDAIGYCAFEGCHNLATLTFEGGSDASNLTSIDGGAFNNCSALKSLVLPSSLRTLGESAFSNCTSLTTVTLPDDLEFVDGAVFSGCSALKEFKGNNVSADGRCLIHNGVMKGFAPADLTSYTLPDSIEGLCNHLFEDFTTITSITLPSSLRNIGEWCFSGCNGLTSITIPERVDNIEAYAFYSCEKLAAVYAKPTDPPALSTEVFGGSRPSTFKIYVAAQNIDKYKSSWSSYKSYIVVDKSGDPIATDWSIVGTHCAWTVDNGTQMTVSGEYAVANGVTFASDGEFKFVANKSWDINYGVEPGTTVKLGETYQGKASADNIKVAAGTYNIKFSIYDATFVIEKGSINPNTVITYTSTDGNIVTPYQLDAFGVNIISNTYNNDQGQIIFDGEVKAVGYDAFNGCTTLASIALPEGVTEIGYRAFRGCSELTGVTLPNSITTFADHVFNACGKLQSIALPKSLRKIGNYAFNNCNSLEFVHVLEMADWCNITFSNNTSTPLYYAKKLYCNGVEVTEANIPEGITAISDYAFYNCVPLTKVTIPSSVTSIGGYSFQNCSNIKYVYCNPTTPPTIGSYVFMHVADGSYHYTNCTIYVPENSVTAYMSAKGWVDYADRIMSAGYANNVIRYTSTDGKVVTPYSADVFGVNIVSNSYTDGQGVIVLSDNPTKIGAFAFRDCKTLKTISIPTTVQEIGNSAFNNCSSLESIYIPGSVTTIGTQAFYGCNSIESVRIPDSVTSIGEVAFGFCASLSEFKGKFASSDGRCLIVDGTLNSFAQAGVTEYTLPKTVKTIGFYAMHNSAQLTTVTIPASVTAIAEGAFNGCISLASVYCKPTTPPTGGSAMFDNNAANRKIYVPEISVEAYKAADGWKEYADAIVAEEVPEHYQGTPTIEVTPASVTIGLAGGTTEAVTITTPAEWTVTVPEGVSASVTAGNGDATVTFDVPEVSAARNLKVTFTATGYVGGFAITKDAELTIIQSDINMSQVIYSDDCGETVSKVNGYWPNVDAYTGWAPKGGDGVEQTAVKYTGNLASVRDSIKERSPVGATYASDAPYAYIAKSDAYFTINEITLKPGVQNYIFSFTAFNQYASLVNYPYTPAPIKLESGKNLTLYVSVDGKNWGTVAFTTEADGNWQYSVAPFALPANSEKLYIKFADYKADTTTALPSSDYKYQAAVCLDDFTLAIGGDGPTVDFNNQGGTTTPTDAVAVTVEQFLAAAEDSTLYELTGVISNVTNTTYGNFDLTDATGTVLIYGLCSPSGEAKYWAASGAKAGDTITVRTVRTSYNGTPHGKNALFVSLVPGEGGDEPAPTPAEGAYASDAPFVCVTDDSSNAVYGLAATNINGQAATGFKLGKSKQQGKFTSAAIGVSGSKYINFYASAWKGTTATLYFRVDGGAVQSVALTANDGATGGPPYPITYAATDHYSVKLDGLTATSTIEFSTNSDFALTTHSGTAPDIAPRVIVCGVKLTDEPIDAENPGGNVTPEPTPDPTPGDSSTSVSTIVFADAGLANAEKVDGRLFKIGDSITAKFEQGGAWGGYASYCLSLIVDSANPTTDTALWASAFASLSRG